MKILFAPRRSAVVRTSLLSFVGVMFLAVFVPGASAVPNPVPFVTAISPVSVAPGGADFTLTVNGANFVGTSTVNWGNTALTTTFVSSSQLTATVPAALTAASGTGWITVSNTGVAKSNLFFLPVANAVTGLRLVSQSYSTGSGPHYGAAGDFNNDGKQDIVVSNANSNTISVLLGNGDGTFQTQTTYATGISSSWVVATGDLNNDGNLDVVVGSTGGATMSVLLGNGDGTFQAARTVTSGSGVVVTPALADVNGDGKLDIVVACDNGHVAVLLGNGDGTFQAATLLNDTGGIPVWSLTVGDINGDGKIDIVAGDNGGGTTIDLFLGNGDGTFQPATTLDTTMQFPLSPRLADLNGDGKVDIVVESELGGGAAIFLGNGNGTFQAPTMVAMSGSPLTVEIEDMNGDGKLDLITPGPSGGLVAIAFGNGDGTFQAAQKFGTSTFNYSAFLGNFSASGGLSIAVPSYSGSTVTVLQTTLTISPSPFDFGSIGVSSPSPAQTLTITNTTANTVTISGISFTGTNAGDFAETDTCTSPLASGGTCDVHVTFTPAGTGAESAALSVANDAPGNPNTVSLTGTGVAAPIVQLSGALLAFGNASQGSTSASQSVTITNIGTADLTGISISLSGTDSGEFAQTNTCTGTLTPTSTCALTVTFSPTSPGAKTASVQIADNAGNSPQSISLTGTGVALAAVVSLSHNTLSFGNQGVGTTSSAQSVTVTNTGNTPLTGIALTVTGANASDFTKTTTCSASLAASATCSISVTFAPGATGAKSASISVADSATGSPQLISLSGNAVQSDYTVSVNPAVLNIQAGQTGTATFTVTPTGNYSGTVQLACSGLPDGSTCVFQPAQAVLDGSNTAVTVQLAIHTTGANSVLSAMVPTAPTKMPPLAPAFLLTIVGAGALVLFRAAPIKRVWPRCRFAAWVLVGCGMAIGIAGCGSSKAPTTPAPSLATPAGQYSANVTATAGSSSHSAALTITITQ